MTDVERSSEPNVDEDIQSTVFRNLENGKTYWVLIEEDAEEAKRSEERSRAFAQRKEEKQKDDNVSGFSQKKRGVELLTEELKKLSADELREAGPRYKELLAARDLEDCLFS